MGAYPDRIVDFPCQMRPDNKVAAYIQNARVFDTAHHGDGGRSYVASRPPHIRICPSTSGCFGRTGKLEQLFYSTFKVILLIRRGVFRRPTIIGSHNAAGNTTSKTALRRSATTPEDPSHSSCTCIRSDKIHCAIATSRIQLKNHRSRIPS